jgi:hypothetical protein
MTSTATDEQWEAALAADEPDAPEEEAPDLSDDDPAPAEAASEADAPPPGFSPEEWAALPAAAQQKMAQTIEAVEQRGQEQYDRLAARHEDVQASYTATMKSFKELSEVFKRPEEPADKSPAAPAMPDPEEVDWSDGRAVAKYTQAVVKASAAETEAKIRGELAGEFKKSKEETQQELYARAQQEEQVRASRAIQEFQAAHQDMDKHRAAMSAIIVQGEMEEMRLQALGKPVPYKSENQKLEAAYQEAKEQEEYRNYKAQKAKSKTSPSPTGQGAGRGTTAPPSKERKTLAESFDAAVARFEKSTGKKVEF